MDAVDRDYRNALPFEINIHSLLDKRGYEKDFSRTFNQHHLAGEKQAGLGSIKVALKIGNVLVR